MKKIKPILVSVLLGTFILSFQNCGNDVIPMDIVGQSEEVFSSEECSDASCTNPQDYLWMKIREYEPYKIEYATLNSAGHFSVGGQCGISTFKNHSFLWELREGFGPQRVVGQGFSDNLCLYGRFTVPIIANQLQVFPDQRYQLTMEIVGLTETNEQISSTSPTSKGTLDVIFTPEAPQ